MDVRDNSRHDDSLPLRKPAKKRACNNKIPPIPKPSLPPEAERPFRQLMDRLMGDDLDIRCRTILWLQENGIPQVMHQIFYEVQGGPSQPQPESTRQGFHLALLPRPTTCWFPAATAIPG